MAEQRKACETCIFWSRFPEQQQPPGQDNGLCRRFPPTIVFTGYAAPAGKVLAASGPGQVQAVPQFASRPAVTPSVEWCGEYEPACDRDD